MKLTPKETEVLSILRSADRITSRELARQSGLRATSLRTIIHNLKRKKFPIHTTYGRGYKLESLDER